MDSEMLKVIMKYLRTEVKTDAGTGALKVIESMLIGDGDGEVVPQVGKKIKAIKAVRTYMNNHGMPNGLREAKDIVELTIQEYTSVKEYTS